MKKERPLMQQLQDKFDELPVPRQGAADWQKMQKALDVAMPVAAFSFLMHLKFKLAKKMLLLYLAGLGVGGSAIVVIYQSRQHNPDPKQAIAKTDTIRRKHKSAPPAARRDTITRQNKTLLPVRLGDKIVNKQKALPPMVAKDTVSRKFTKAPQPYLPNNTTIHKHKIPPPVVPKDTIVRKQKIWPKGDTVGRKHKDLTPPHYNPKFNKENS